MSPSICLLSVYPDRLFVRPSCGRFFQQVRIAIERLGDVLNQPVEPGTGSRVALPELKGTVAFEGVKFRYGLDGP